VTGHALFATALVVAGVALGRRRGAGARRRPDGLAVQADALL
jgi:hypothetical protein